MLTPRGASYDLECLLRSVISLGHLGLTGVVCCFKCCIAKAKLNLDGMTSRAVFMASIVLYICTGWEICSEVASLVVYRAGRSLHSAGRQAVFVLVSLFFGILAQDLHYGLGSFFHICSETTMA